MLKVFSYLKLLDEKIFALVADFKNGDFYNNLNQKINSLDEPVQKAIQLCCFSLVLFIPIIVGTLLVVMIYNTSSRISHKSQIVELTEIQLSLTKQVEKFNNTIIAQSSVETEDDIRSAITNNTTIGAMAPKIDYKNFNQTPLVGNFKDSQLTITFNEISTIDLADLLNFFYKEYKARIINASLNRNDKKKLLDGEISFNIISN